MRVHDEASRDQRAEDYEQHDVYNEDAFADDQKPGEGKGLLAEQRRQSAEK